MSFRNYKKYEPVKLDDRRWPSNTIKKAPIWCSVDLRDGNQSLPIPMNVEKKTKMFYLLKEMGFKEIEVGFPSASKAEFDFTRKLIEENMLDDDMTIQVLTQAREELIKKTFKAIDGCKRAIVHVYNSTSTLQREVVFKKDKKAIIDIAVNGVKLIKECAKKSNAQEIILEYSPESFTGTELDYALDICEAVIEAWEPTEENKIIINLPATVEMSMPNVYADQIEWFSRNISCRDRVIISVHTHNDRGTGVAATELAMLAGADRVEGTLFGNGERTGNLDMLTVAMNLYSQGIDPELNINNINHIINVYEECTLLKVHERHPYAGELVYTAFSGSHQDAIKKGLDVNNQNENKYWEVPYLPINPSDIGREYEAIIRINSQSGKGGIAYILQSEYGYRLPKKMHPEVGKLIQGVTDRTGKELNPQEIFDIFNKEYFEQDSILSLNRFESIIEDKDTKKKDVRVTVSAEVTFRGETKQVKGIGNGPIAAFVKGIRELDIEPFKLVEYEEHSMNGGADAQAVAYIGLINEKDEVKFGIGKDSNINLASIRALISAINRHMKN
ncbi:2-isopropylmalate synthase [Vallitalea sp.]|jgi:2-isopropylmalate synthase|uniref:2-isopropylmalate synthase n=1 Tax=Vallitalea sp. TaxID=1882829 RepID=UPI0025D902E7|nr:2-isopropylmalate synthase [Vallitalea sp.]MCT4688115.1 2-isopropylmalate synthase [Vallitalea sp.]